MDVLMIALYILMTLSAIGLILFVVLQPGQAAGMGALTGETEGAMARNTTKSFEQKLGKWTKIAAAVLFALSFTIALLEQVL